MTPPLSERQQIKVLLQTTAPKTKISALNTTISPIHYLKWSAARRRAWDKRHSSPNNYFLHHLHPSISPSPPKWSVEEHHLFLAALQRAPPSDDWGLFSLLVPGRIGSQCRRYFHRIGRAGFITINGKVRTRLVAKAKIKDGETALESKNPLFLRRCLRKFCPKNLPQVDDSLYRSLEKRPPRRRTGSKAPVNRSTRDSGKRKQSVVARDTKLVKCQSARSTSSKILNGAVATKPIAAVTDMQDLLTYIPAKAKHDDTSSTCGKQDRDVSIVSDVGDSGQVVRCRLRVRPSKESEILIASKSVGSRKATSKAVVCDKMSERQKKDVPEKMQTNFLNLRDSQSRVAKSGMTRRSRYKEASIPIKVKKSNGKTQKKLEREKENDALRGRRCREPATGMPIPTRDSLTKPKGDTRKGGNVKQLNTVQPLLDHHNDAEGILSQNSRKLAQPLKSILRSNYQRETGKGVTKTVHFTRLGKVDSNRVEGKSHSACAKEFSDQKLAHPLDIPEEDAVNQASPEGNSFLRKEVDGETSQKDDKQSPTSRGNASPESLDSGMSIKFSTRASSEKPTLPLGCDLKTGSNAPLLRNEKLQVGQAASSGSLQPTCSINGELQEQTCDNPISTATASGKNPNFAQVSERSENATIKPLDKASSGRNPEACVDEHELELAVMTVCGEGSSTESDSQNTAGDGELLNIRTDINSPTTNETETCENVSEYRGAEISSRNPRRVSGLTKRDRASISFLMNDVVDESVQKKQKHECDRIFHNESGKDITKSVASQLDPCDNLAKSPEPKCGGFATEIEDDLVTHGLSLNPRSEYVVMQTRVEQTHLMLCLFVDDVEPIGEQLGHKLQRARLLQSYAESMCWIRFTEGQAAKKRPIGLPPVLETARTAAEMDNLHTESKRHTIHAGGMTRYWGQFVDGYIERLREMEGRQKMEVEGTRSVSSVF